MQVGIASYVGTTIFDFQRRISETVHFDFSQEQDFLADSIFDLSCPAKVTTPSTPDPVSEPVDEEAPELDESARSNGLWYLAMHPRPSVREYVAGNSETPSDCLEYLSKDKHAGVREMVAEHPSCPIPVLRKLSEDSNLKVRRAVAANSKTQRDVLRRLSEELDPTIRAAVAANASASP